MILWINGAVGIIGSEDNPMNLLFGVVLLVGVISAIAVRLEAPGMARTMFVVAFAQFLVPVVAYVIGRTASPAKPERRRPQRASRRSVHPCGRD